MKKILIVGNWGTTHIRRFLRVLCENKEQNLIVDAFDTRIDENQGNECGVDNVYRVTASPCERVFYRIRKVGTYFAERKKTQVFEDIISHNDYDLVNIHFLPANVESYVSIANKHGVKVMLTPLGSDVLRASKFSLPSIKRAFDNTNYVSANKLTGFYYKVKELFNVDENKFIDLGYGSETLSTMLEMKGKYNREQFIAMLNIPYSDYYICCGYTASFAQRHKEMIEAIAANKSLLPSNFCLLIPLSYGSAKEELQRELSVLCNKFDLKYHIFTDYMTNKQVAALRYIANLMIHIQPTDAYNSSLQEFLLGGTDIINGKWLDYPSLERHGKPYYICESLVNLSETLSNVLSGRAQKVSLHPEIIDEITSNAWSNRIIKWVEFYRCMS